MLNYLSKDDFVHRVAYGYIAKSCSPSAYKFLPIYITDPSSVGHLGQEFSYSFIMDAQIELHEDSLLSVGMHDPMI